ncbi:hypothetical protein [Reticulibacter mediterranei]|uniref:hypothetical protein n=1 Tax=Reticulibacter mediterranei TaxID=2778369 RepID=UPI001C691015|nr:hypothetical protein [Reticulibacter mediterranei]
MFPREIGMSNPVIPGRSRAIYRGGNRWTSHPAINRSTTTGDSSGLSSSPLKGVQGSPCRGLGRPQFPSLLRAPPQAARKREEKSFLRGHPAPRQRAAALCTPARWENWKALGDS